MVNESDSIDIPLELTIKIPFIFHDIPINNPYEACMVPFHIVGDIPIFNPHDLYGAFHKCGYPNSWRVYKRKSIYTWMILGYPHLWKTTISQ
jgi:hypothetical protein